MVASNERERKRERERERERKRELVLSNSVYTTLTYTPSSRHQNSPQIASQPKARKREREQIYQIKSIALVMCLGILNSVGAVSLSLVSVQAAGCELLHIVRSINLSVFVKVFFTFFAL